jgi:hypothetical protein
MLWPQERQRLTTSNHEVTAGDLNHSPEWGYDAVQRAFSQTYPTARIRGFSPHGA